MMDTVEQQQSITPDIVMLALQDMHDGIDLQATTASVATPRPKIVRTKITRPKKTRATLPSKPSKQLKVENQQLQKKKKKNGKAPTAPPSSSPTPASGWILKPSEDSPVICWIDKGYRYAVQNPSNQGKTLLKMEIYDAMSSLTSPLHRSGVFLDKTDFSYSLALSLAYELENTWVDRSTGLPKVAGITQTMEKICE